MSRSSKHRKLRIKSINNYLRRGENLKCLPDPSGLILLPRESNCGTRRKPKNSLVCGQGHCRGQHSAPGLLPSKASSHSLHSDYNPVIWNAQHFCNKALHGRKRSNIALHWCVLWPFPGLTLTYPTCLGLSSTIYSSIPGIKILLTSQCCLVPGSSTHWSPQTESGNSIRILAFNHTDKIAAYFQSKSSSLLARAFRSEK